MFCHNCGKQIPDGSDFCPECGATQNTKAAAPNQPSQTPVQYSAISRETGIDRREISMYQYVVLQVTLKEKFIGTGSKNLSELEGVINKQASMGYRLHTITTASADSKGFAGGDRIQATMVFERV
ncbi:MAG: DUF4177 domain-containing protein [Oscillospiraceae bacterium]